MARYQSFTHVTWAVRWRRRQGQHTRTALCASASRFARASPNLRFALRSICASRFALRRKVGGELEVGMVGTSLVPRPFLRGRGKTAWAPLLAHARRSHKNMGIRARLCIVRLHISNISVHDYECLSVLLQLRER